MLWCIVPFSLSEFAPGSLEKARPGEPIYAIISKYWP